MKVKNDGKCQGYETMVWNNVRNIWLWGCYNIILYCILFSQTFQYMYFTMQWLHIIFSLYQLLNNMH